MKIKSLFGLLFNTIKFYPLEEEGGSCKCRISKCQVCSNIEDIDNNTVDDFVKSIFKKKKAFNQY